MPVNAEDALKNVLTLELNEKESKWFEKLCLYTDYWINHHFDGDSVHISFDRMFIPNPEVKNGEINCGWQPYSMPHWRQAAVVRLWIKTYENLGWRISPDGDKWSDDRYSAYKFEVDKRDIAIRKILE